MKLQKIKLVAITACMAMMLVGGANAEESNNSIGTVVGNVYSTDIVALWDGMPIPSYNIGGRTAVAVQDLVEYGFSVEWLPAGDIFGESQVKVTAQALPEICPSYTPEQSVPGLVIGSIYKTDISVYVNGVKIPSYNIGGHMVICLADLAADYTDNQFGINCNSPLGYSNAGFHLTWDERSRTASMTSMRLGGTLAIGEDTYTVDSLTSTFVSGLLSIRDDYGEILLPGGSSLAIITPEDEVFYDKVAFQALHWNLENIENGVLNIDASEIQNNDGYQFAYSYPKQYDGFFALPIINIPVRVYQNKIIQDCTVHGLVWNGQILISDSIFESVASR